MNTGHMRTRTLGHSGIEVSTIGFGVMMFGAWGNTDEAACHRMVDIALDGGVTLFDTADMYDNGVSEEILGRALGARRDRIVLATKVGNPMDYDQARSGLSRRWITTAVEDSLRRLQTDHIDLYQMHRPDPSTPIEETLAVFDELVTAGKVGAIGTSTFSPEQLAEAHRVAAEHGWARPTSEQPPYSVLARGIEAEVLPLCRQLDVATLVWAPLNGGWLTGKYQQDAGGSADDRAVRQPDHFDHRDAAIRETKRRMVDELTTIAAEAGVSLIQLALGFVLRDPVVATALIGPRTPEQLEQLLAAGHVELGADTLAAIDTVIMPGTNVNPADAG